MTYQWLTDLDQCFNAAGVPYIEVGYSAIDPTYASAWRTRGRPYSTGAFDPEGVLCHHTASPEGTSDEAELNVLLAGNGSAPGPISQLFIGRSATLYLVAAGRANHGGKGVMPGEGDTSDMNARLVGIEVANNGVGEQWADDVTNLYAATVAALIDWYSWAIDDVYLHATTGPPAGNYKIDPAGPWPGQPDLGGGTWDLETWRAFIGDLDHDVVPAPARQGDDDMFLLESTAEPGVLWLIMGGYRCRCDGAMAYGTPQGGARMIDNTPKYQTDEPIEDNYPLAPGL